MKHEYDAFDRPTGQDQNRLKWGSRMLYDPNGGYKSYDEYGDRVQGTGDFAENRQFNFLDYIRYQVNSSSGFISGGSEVYVYVFDTTPEEERSIAGNIENQPGRGLFPKCAENVTSVLQGIGPFKNLEVEGWPSSVRRQLDGIVKGGKGTKQTAEEYLKKNTSDPGRTGQKKEGGNVPAP